MALGRVGPVVVEFGADNSGFAAGLREVRESISKVRDETSAASKAMSSAWSLAKKALGVVAIAGAARAIIRNTIEAEASQASLNNALATAGANVKLASAEYAAFATQLQRTTTFGDEAIMQVQTLLLSFQGLSGQIVKDATSAVLDLSTRMGVDAPSAAKLLGKALSDPEKGLTSLTRVGVTFSAAQKEQIKQMVEAGDVAGAQGVILKSLEERFGGAAEAARDTLGGALTGLQNAFGELLEPRDGMPGLTTAVNDLTTTISSPEFQSATGALLQFLADTVGLAAKAVVGISKIFNWDHLKPQNKALEEQIRLTENQIAIWESSNPGGMRGDVPKANLANAKAELLALRARLVEQKELERQEAVYGAPLRRFGVDPSKSGALDFVTGDTPAEQDPAGDSAEGATLRVLQLKNAAEALMEYHAAEQQAISEAFELEANLHNAKQALLAEGLEAGDEAALRLTQVWQEESDRRVQIEQEAQERLNALRLHGFDLATNGLQLLGAKNKVITAGVFAFQKRHELAEGAMAVKAAVLKTYARFGYPWGIPAAAAVGALGAASLAQMAGIQIGSGGGGSISAGGGGGSIQSPDNPIYTQAGEDQSYGAGSQKVLQVMFNGPVYGMRDFQQDMIDILREAIDDRDVVIIGGNSRQAMELQG